MRFPRRRPTSKDIFNSAYGFENAGDIENAIKEYKRALESSPDYGGAWHNLGSLYLRTRQWTRAADAYAKAWPLLLEMKNNASLPAEGRFHVEFLLGKIWDEAGQIDAKLGLKLGRASACEKIYGGDPLENTGYRMGLEGLGSTLPD